MKHSIYLLLLFIIHYSEGDRHVMRSVALAVGATCLSSPGHALSQHFCLLYFGFLFSISPSASL